MNIKKCYLFGAGPLYDKISLGADDYVIAVDGGFESLKKEGFEADMVVGDFDSAKTIPDHPNVVVLKKDKDETDMFFAIEIGLKQGFDEFYIYGGTGGRLDHTLANIQCLAYIASKGKRGFLVDEKNTITAVKNGKISFSEKSSGRVSVFSNSQKSTGVFITGMKYPLTNATVTSEFPIGISNELTLSQNEISVKDGTLIIFYPKTAEII